jgi:catechol 2,3-dioxygenase-like lactoylglutathione lyase family enzyme
MLDHIGLDVTDVKRSASFYKAALAPLGIKVSDEDDSSRAFTDDDTDVSLYLTGGRSKTSNAHVAFRARDTGSVDAFYAAALENGGTENGPPGNRDYAPGYYAAFVLDPDGNNVEAVHMS